MRTFTLNRDRIVLTSLPDRSLVVKEYPSLEDPELEWERLAQVATCAIESTEDANRAPRAFGFNYEWVFDVGADETAAGLLGERLLNQRGSKLHQRRLEVGRRGWYVDVQRWQSALDVPYSATSKRRPES